MQYLERYILNNGEKDRMLKRIKLIKNIGVFSDFEAKKEKLENDFSKFNLIYGLNTSGKTTLCDLLKDLNEKEDVRIQKRKTIPGKGDPETVISFDNVTSVYKNDKWVGKFPKNKFIFFDSEFILNNVFDGPIITKERLTKENFTSFILGDEGVQIAKELNGLNVRKRDENSKLKIAIPKSQEGKKQEEIEKYTKEKINESLDDLINRFKEKEIRINQIKEQEKNIECLKKFTIHNEFSKVDITKLENELINVRDLLAKTYKLNAESIEKFNKHIFDYCHNDQKASQWLSQGLNYIDDKKKCPFCEQDISNNKVLEIYNNVLDKKYRNFVSEIKREINRIDINWNVKNVSGQIIELISYNKKAIESFGTDIPDESAKIKKISTRLLELEDNIGKLCLKSQKLVQDSINVKQQIPISVINIDFSDLKLELERYKTEIDKVNDIIVEINKNINNAKKVLDSNISKIDKMQQEIDLINRKITRIKESEQCQEWLAHFNEMNELSKKIKVKTEELIEKQSKYLDDYFEEINNIYAVFGGNKYKIKKGKLDNRGKNKIIGVNITFNGQRIKSNEDTKQIFSESDRRALAMAIFFAKIKKLSDEEKENLILVLDDPVTSFDENRITSTINQIEDLSQKVHQTFVFTHHSLFVKTCYKYNKDTLNYYSIDKCKNGSNGLFDLNTNDILLNDIEKAYKKINKFIKGEINTIDASDLRIFLEEYLNVVFVRQYEDYKIDNMRFANRIDKLYEIGVISEAAKSKLNRFRSRLNPDLHKYSHLNIEDKRNLANEIIQYIFNNIKINKSSN